MSVTDGIGQTLCSFEHYLVQSINKSISQNAFIHMYSAMSQAKDDYSFYRPTEGRRLSQPRWHG